MAVIIEKMSKQIRYGDYLGVVRLKQKAVSYNDTIAFEHRHPRRYRLRPRDFYRLLAPYISVRFLDQARAVLPLVLFLTVFQIGVLQAPVQGWNSVLAGVLAVMGGLMFFMEGVKQGLMPFSEAIGYRLPGRSPMGAVLMVAFILGVAATFAEPAIGALKAAGSITRSDATPLLYALLHGQSHLLVLAVGLGVGLAVLVGMLRFIRGWSLKKLLVFTLMPALGLTAYIAFDPGLAPILGLAWDCGAITTGPVTVPLVLALGIGVSAAVGREDNPLSGFGIVTLASLFPAIAVMLLGIGLSWDGIPGNVAAAVPQHAGPSVFLGELPFLADILSALRAILPLVLILWLVQRFVLKEQTEQPRIIGYGVSLTIAGMALFSVGLDYGLVALGNQAGNLLPAAFARFSSVAGSPLFSYEIGIALVLLFAAFVGFGATMAEPALNAMGVTVQNLTDGAFRKDMLIRSVAAGVALGTTLGVVKVLFQLPIAAFLLPGYVLALMLTVLSSEEYVNLAWDSAGVTTGPVTVPLVLAMGLGLGETVGAEEGFGILAMASLGPIVSVLAVGQWINLRARWLTWVPRTSNA